MIYDFLDGKERKGKERKGKETVPLNEGVRASAVGAAPVAPPEHGPAELARERVAVRTGRTRRAGDRERERERAGGRRLDRSVHANGARRGRGGRR